MRVSGIKAGFIAANGEAIEGMSLLECAPATRSGTDIQVQWKQTDQVPDSSSEPRRLVFELSNARRYSFWID
jgi:hypothetical protein